MPGVCAVGGGFDFVATTSACLHSARFIGRARWTTREDTQRHEPPLIDLQQHQLLHCTSKAAGPYQLENAHRFLGDS